MSRGALRLTCAAQALVVALGCVVAAVRQPDRGSIAPAAVSRPGPGGSSKSRAQQEARWLLSLTRVPVGARMTSHRSPHLPGPVMGTPGVDSLVIRTAYWRVPSSYAATLNWLKAHPPNGLVQSGSAESGGPDGSTAGYGYSDRPSPSWTSADLDIGVAPDGDGSLIRADGVVVWLDPKPIRDAASGTRLRVTLAEGCPASDRGIVGVRNGAPLNDQLVPTGQPSRGLVCRYDGLNGQPFRLNRSTSLDAHQAASLAEAVRTLPLSHTDGGDHGCPMDDASAAVVALSYPGSADVDIWVALNGCAFVSNGHIVAAAGSVPELISHLR